MVMKTEFESLAARNGGLHRMQRSDDGSDKNENWCVFG